MNEQQFAKKIVQVLDEKPIAIDMEFRLKQARLQALKAHRDRKVKKSKAIFTLFIPMMSGMNGVLSWGKGFNENNYFKGLIILTMITCLMLISITVLHQYNGEQELYKTDPQSLADLDIKILSDEKPIEYWVNKKFDDSKI